MNDRDEAIRRQDEAVRRQKLAAIRGIRVTADGATEILLDAKEIERLEARKWRTIALSTTDTGTQITPALKARLRAEQIVGLRRDCELAGLKAGPGAMRDAVIEAFDSSLEVPYGTVADVARLLGRPDWKTFIGL